MKRFFKFIFLHYTASKAMSAIISNQSLYNTIVKLSLEKESSVRDEEITDYVVGLSYRYARKMNDKI